LTPDRAFRRCNGVKAKARARKTTLPTRPVLDELKFLRTTFREIVTHYTGAIEGEIARLVSLVTAEDEAQNPEHSHDVRDLLVLLRGLDVKPAKGRRRDLKKIETVVDELRRIAERW
jgi:hypothetical protein